MHCWLSFQGVRWPDLLAVLSDSELIADELRQQLLRCTCAAQFPIQRAAEPGKYRVGNWSGQIQGGQLVWANAGWVNSLGKYRVGKWFGQIQGG